MAAAAAIHLLAGIVALLGHPNVEQMHVDFDAEDLPRDLVDNALEEGSEAVPVAVVAQGERCRRDLSACSPSKAIITALYAVR